LIPCTPISTLFPYTTLFRSDVVRAAVEQLLQNGTDCLHAVRHGCGCASYAAHCGTPYRPVNTSQTPRARTARARPITASTGMVGDRKSTRLNSSHLGISYAV